MTPQLQQAIKLLQLNNLEIGEFVAQEMQQNPLLDEGGHTDQDRPMDNTEASQDRVAIGESSGDAPASTDDQASHMDAGALGDQSHDIVDGVEVVATATVPQRAATRRKALPRPAAAAISTARQPTSPSACRGTRRCATICWSS